MVPARFRGLAAWLSVLALGAAASAAVAVDAVAPLNGTALGEVPAGGRASAIGVLVPAGTSKGSITVKAARGSLLAPRVSLVRPDGTTVDQEGLAALGAVVKATPKSVSVKNLPLFPATGLYKVVVSGAPGGDGKATAGAYSLKLGGKAPTAFTAPPASIGTLAEKDDYPLEVPENALLAVALKPSKLTPFGVSLKILAASGDEIDYGPWSTVGTDDSITIKNMPLPAFGHYTLRVGSTAATGDYTLVAKVKASKKPIVFPGAPVADAGGPYFLEPSTKGALDASGTIGASSYLWIPVSGPPLSFSNKVPNPVINAPATRATYAWQLVARNPSGPSLPSLAVLEINRAPVADAGPSATIPFSTAQLDGSGSTDLDAGDVLHYRWTQVSGPGAAIDDLFAQKPTVTPGSQGACVFSLVVHDGVLPSEPSFVVVNMGPSGAAADAGRAVIVRPQETVFLSGLRSRKADGTAPSQWAWSALPGNAASVALAGADGPVASFTAPKVPARLGFRLAVEGDAAAADEVLVVVTAATPINGTPVADAGGAVSAALSAPFDLDGSGSTDDGSVQAFEWMQADGTDADLQQAGSAAASGTAPASAEVLRFLLMVHDGRKYGAPDAALVAAGAPAAPVASAGPDRSGTTGAVLNLTSAASVPAPGQTILSRQWTQLSGRDWYDADAMDPGFDPSAASPLLSVPTTVSSLSPTRTLHFGLTVTDSTGTSRQDYATVVFQNLQKNAPPQVSASTTASVFRPGATVALNASATDADGDPLTYSWTQVSGPAAVVTSPNLAAASVTAPVATATLVYRVTVSDGTGEPNAVATADVSFSVNRPPVVGATSTPASGPDGTFVTLSGTTTTDPDGETLTFAWSEIPPLTGSPVTLSGASTATATFTMPAYTGTPTARRRTFRLTVTDSMGPSFPATRDVTFSPNRAPEIPTLVTGGDRKVFYSDSSSTSSDKSETVSVTSLTDPDGDALTFSWTVESGPITSTAVLLSATSGSSITFRSAPKPTSQQQNTGGIYVLGVTATDGVEQSAKSTVEMLVLPSWSGDIYAMVTASCGTGTSGCHSSVAPGGGLVMSGGASAAHSAVLSGRVTANNPSASSFFTKIDSGSMPKGGSKLPQAVINMVRDWIEPEWNASPKPGLSPGAENN